MKIAFGSCNRQWRSQRHWDLIAAHKPDLWIWLGDMIYSDFSTMSRRKREYDKLKADPHYKAFRAKVPVIGTWDDHDYAYNNKDGTFKGKKKSLALACEFLDQPVIDGRSGIYRSYEFGFIKVVLLDLRYNQSKKNKTLLGKEQWAWFEAELAKGDYKHLILGSSLNTGYGWHKFPYDLGRLIETLNSVTKPLTVISGDRHMGEFCKLQTSKPIFEVMSSGLTHNRNGKASPHATMTIRQPNFGILDVLHDGVHASIYSSVDNRALGGMVVG